MGATLDRISQHSFLPFLLRNGVVLDLGGNRGEFSHQIKRDYGHKVVAVEPTPHLAAYLRGTGVEVIEAAAAGEDGRASFTFDSAQELTGSILGPDVVSFLDETAIAFEVPALSLATLIRQQDKPVDLVKVDIEGAELDLFLSASDDTLLSVPQFTVEFHDYWYPELAARTEQVKQRLKSLGFWMMRGTPNNKDVLFVHPEWKPNILKRLYIGLWLRNLHGLGRALLALYRKVRPAPPPALKPPAPIVTDRYGEPDFQWF